MIAAGMPTVRRAARDFSGPSVILLPGERRSENAARTRTRPASGSRRRLRRRWPGSRAGLGLGAHPAQAGPGTDTTDRPRLIRCADCGTAGSGLPRAPVSRLWAPRQGRSLRSRRTRSASPNLDSAPTRQGISRLQGRSGKTRTRRARPAAESYAIRSAKTRVTAAARLETCSRS